MVRSPLVVPGNGKRYCLAVQNLKATSALLLVSLILAGNPVEARRRIDPPPAPQPPVQYIIKYVTRPDPPPAPPLEFGEDLGKVWDVIRSDPGLGSIIAEYKRSWLSVAMPFLAGIVPRDLPRTLVYPFGGGDLVSAIATFPDATDITTISLEPAGEAAALFRGGGMGAKLSRLRKDVGFLLRSAFSRTEDMDQQIEEQLPVQLLYSLMALRVHGLEPVGLKYFRFGPAGEIKYWNEPDLKTQINLGNTHVWDDMELTYKGPDGGTRVHRHIYIDLSDKRFTKDPVLLKFLETKGKVSAMTKACSYLLWENGFSVIRKYLLDHAVWMISDATGVPPSVAREAGFEQVTYGTFNAAIMKVDQGRKEEMRLLWKNQPHRKLPFRYGYPNHGSGEGHLMIMRPAGGAPVSGGDAQ